MAIAAMLHDVLLRPLPYRDPGRLVSMPHNLSPPELADVATMNRAFESVGGAALQPYDLKIGSEPIQGMAAMASGALFETLGVRAALGRTLRRSDDVQGGERIVVLGRHLEARVGRRSLHRGTLDPPQRRPGPSGVLRPSSLPEQKVDLYVPLWAAYPSVGPGATSTSCGPSFA
jgi:hypothetical protein